MSAASNKGGKPPAKGFTGALAPLQSESKRIAAAIKGLKDAVAEGKKLGEERKRN